MRRSLFVDFYETDLQFLNFLKKNSPLSPTLTKIFEPFASNIRDLFKENQRFCRKLNKQCELDWKGELS